MKLDLLNDDHIFLNIASTDRNEVFKQVNTVLSKNGYVAQDYLQKVIARENDHPTGFKLTKINVAMPHVDPEFVNKNGLFVVTSKQGILFKNAETDEDLKVNIIFGLLLKDSGEHLNFLMKLASSFKNDEKLIEILNSQSKNEVKSLLNSILSK